MSDRIFDRETLLDLTVNIIPLVIILFFAILILISNPVGNDVVALVMTEILHFVPFASLALVTYVAGRIISEAERTGHSETAASITRTLIGETSISESETEDNNR